MSVTTTITRLRQRGCRLLVADGRLVVIEPADRRDRRALLIALYDQREEAGAFLREEQRTRGTIRGRIARALAPAAASGTS